MNGQSRPACELGKRPLAGYFCLLPGIPGKFSVNTGIGYPLAPMQAGSLDDSASPWLSAKTLSLVRTRARGRVERASA